MLKNSRLVKDQQLKTTLYIYKLLYQHLMGATNLKITIDTHTQRSKSNPNTTLKMVIKLEEKRTKEGEGKGPTKTNLKCLMAIRRHISIII